MPIGGLLRPVFRRWAKYETRSNFWRVGCWPENIAAKLNPAIVDYLCRTHNVSEDVGDGCTGIVVCDWVGRNGDWDLVRCIVGMNWRLQLKEVCNDTASNTDSTKCM